MPSHLILQHIQWTFYSQGELHNLFEKLNPLANSNPVLVTSKEKAGARPTDMNDPQEDDKQEDDVVYSLHLV